MKNKEISIELYSHYFLCKVKTNSGVSLCNKFSRQFVLTTLVPIWDRFGNRRFKEETSKIFATANKSKTEYRFVINSLNNFKRFLFHEGFNESDVEYKVVGKFESENVEFNIKEKWKPREHQFPVIDFLLNNNITHKLLDLPTGEGKTFCALYALSKIGKRVLMIVKPKYLKKWKEDVEKHYYLNKGDLIIVNSTPSLIFLMEDYLNEVVKPKFIIISNRIMLNWYNVFKELGNQQYDMGYMCKPDEIFHFFKIGVRLIDEAHEDLHIHSLIDLHTHVEDTISLSATMINKNPVIKNMQSLLYPFKSRYGQFLPKKYTDCFAIKYNFEYPFKIKCITGMGYSHTAFEKSLLNKKNNKEYKNYIKLILSLVNEYYIPLNRPKKKLVIFVATIEFVRRLERIVHRAFPKYKVKGYCEDDSRDFLMESDIVITTILKTGTGEDIADLTTVIMTNSIDSIQSNIQTLGRLRKLNDHKTEFIYIYAGNLDKQLEYHKNRKQYFYNRVKSFTDITYEDYI